MRNPIIVALDVPTAGAALKLVEQLAPVSGSFKVGNELRSVEAFRVLQRRRVVRRPHNIEEGAGALFNFQIEQAGRRGRGSELLGKTRVAVPEDLHATARLENAESEVKNG